MPTDGAAAQGLKANKSASSCRCAERSGAAVVADDAREVTGLTAHHDPRYQYPSILGMLGVPTIRGIPEARAIQVWTPQALWCCSLETHTSCGPWALETCTTHRRGVTSRYSPLWEAGCVICSLVAEMYTTTFVALYMGRTRCPPRPHPLGPWHKGIVEFLPGMQGTQIALAAKATPGLVILVL